MSHNLTEKLGQLIQEGNEVLELCKKKLLNDAIELENTRQVAMLNCVQAISQTGNVHEYHSLLQELLGINQSICLVLESERNRIEAHLSALAHGNHAVSEYLSITG